MVWAMEKHVAYDWSAWRLLSSSKGICDGDFSIKTAKAKGHLILLGCTIIFALYMLVQIRNKLKMEDKPCNTVYAFVLNNIYV